MKRSRWFFVMMTLALLIVVVAGTAVWFFLSHRQSVSVSASVAEEELTRIRSRFSRQQALVDMGTRTAAVSSISVTPVPPLRTFHTVVFDTRDGNRLIRIAVPYWLARRYARHNGEFQWLGELTFLDDTEFDPERIRVSLSQLERRGPGLVVDYRHPNSGQFISWVE